MNKYVRFLAGSEWNIVSDSEKYFYKFNANSNFTVAVGDAGEVVTGNYEQLGERVVLWTGELVLEGTYDGKEFKPAESLVDKNFSSQEIEKIAYRMYIKAYLRCVASIDDNVGRVLKHLDDEGLSENTIVAYTSGQGMFLGEHGLFDKRFMYEESLRIPLLIRCPKEIEPASVSADFALNFDFAPTFLDYAGITIPSDMDGKIMRPVLKGQTLGDWRTDMYYRYWMHRGNFNLAVKYGIRSKRFKLIFYYGLGLDAEVAYEGPTSPEWELFDLQNDPSKMNNIYNDPAYKEDIKIFKTRFVQLKKQYQDTDGKYLEMAEVIQRYW